MSDGISNTQTGLSALLEKLCAAAGPSGNEEETARLILDEIGPYAEARRDRLGNILVHKKGAKPAAVRLMLCAHMDEVGFMITSVTEEGFLKFGPVGGIDARVAAGRRVLIGEKRLPGVIGMKVLHLLEGGEKSAAPDFDKLYIDIGAASRGEALAVIHPGDTAVFDAEFARFGDGMLKARAIDDRVGCAILIKLIQSPAEYDLDFAFTVQEEVGTRGAKTAAFALRPEAALVLEATTASDIPFTDEEHKVCRLGKGPVLSFMDRGTIYDRGLYRLASRVAGTDGIPCQPKLAVAGGNDARSVHLAAEGARTLAVSLPCRYLHSPSCVIQESDAEATLRLVRSLAPAIASGRLDA